MMIIDDVAQKPFKLAYRRLENFEDAGQRSLECCKQILLEFFDGNCDQSADKNVKSKSQLHEISYINEDIIGNEMRNYSC